MINSTFLFIGYSLLPVHQWPAFHSVQLHEEGGKLFDAVLYALEVGHDLVVWIMLLIFVVRIVTIQIR